MPDDCEEAILTLNRRPMALACLAALVAAFGLTFALGKASKHSTAPAAAAPALQTVALPSQKPAVANLQTVDAVPALRATPHKAKAKTTTHIRRDDVYESEPDNGQSEPSHRRLPTPPRRPLAVAAAPRGGSTSGGGTSVVGGGTG